mgnify:CR=1 FL=1
MPGMPSHNHKPPTARQQIGPRLSHETRARLDTACQEGRGSVSDIVEAALVQYLTPDETAAPSALFYRVVEMETRLSKRQDTIVEEQQHIRAMLEEILTALHTPAQPLAPHVATYVQMYGEIERAPILDVSPALPLPRPPRPRGWRRWFYQGPTA